MADLDELFRGDDDGEFLRRFCCPHNLRSEPDGEGDAICLKCGAVLDVHLTRRKLELAFEYMQFGRRPT